MEIEVGTGNIEYFRCKEPYFDLYGTDVKYDEVRNYHSTMSLIKHENEFSFYSFGDQIGRNTTFPGGKIVTFNYHYILDENKDLYYMYYCTQLNDPWIKFIKVDENIDKIKSESDYSADNVVISVTEENRHITYPIYIKNNKEYVGICNPKTTYLYGQNYVNHGDYNYISSEDFAIHVLELSPENVSFVTFNTATISASDNFDWYIQYNYIINGYTVFEKNV